MRGAQGSSTKKITGDGLVVGDAGESDCQVAKGRSNALRSLPTVPPVGAAPPRAFDRGASETKAFH